MSVTLATVQAAGVQRNGRWLIKDIDLEIRSGEIVTIIGPNGSGKTTLAQVIAGSIRPDEGTVKRTKGVRVGYVPQRVKIDHTMPLTVRRLMTLTHDSDKSDVDAALEQLNVLRLSEAPVQNLSGGEFQRVLFARALLRKPDLLILDEPSQGLDVVGEASLYGDIVNARDELSCGVLLISHDLHIVMAKTDTVICLNVHICCTGTPEYVISSDEYFELFGKSMQPAYARYRHHHDHRHRLDGSIATP